MVKLKVLVTYEAELGRYDDVLVMAYLRQGQIRFRDHGRDGMEDDRPALPAELFPALADFMRQVEEVEERLRG